MQVITVGNDDLPANLPPELREMLIWNCAKGRSCYVVLFHRLERGNFVGRQIELPGKGRFRFGSRGAMIGFPGSPHECRYLDSWGDDFVVVYFDGFLHPERDN
jgi:hypothetical protein